MNLCLRLLLALWSGVRADRLQHDGLFKKTFRLWPHNLDAFAGFVMNLVHELTEALQQIPNVREDRVASVATEGIEILVAGPAAVSVYLSAYIDADARVLQSLVFLLVLTFL